MSKRNQFQNVFIDYVHGRALKINVSADRADTWLYNQYNGANAAERIIERLQSSRKDVEPK